MDRAVPHQPEFGERLIESLANPITEAPAAVFRDIRIISCPKSPGARSEDAYATTPNCLVVADGATAKTEFAIDPHRTGGEIVARIVADSAVKSTQNGVDLVAELNYAVAAVLRDYGIAALPQGPQTPSCVFACARICGDRLIVTQVGDVGIRINGPSGETLAVRNLIDDLTSAARAHYVRLTNDLAGSRGFILPLLQAQAAYRNNPGHPLGFGVIDGSATPDPFVVTRAFDLAGITTVEIYSDGYPQAPEQVSPLAWEDAYHGVIHRDPHRCLDFPSTKAIDDRTVIIAPVGQFEA